MYIESISGFGGIGMVLAVVLSWSLNRSILWAIIHGIFGWFYVIFHVLTARHRHT
jgi:hypothetical protein